MKTCIFSPPYAHYKDRIHRLIQNKGCETTIISFSRSIKIHQEIMCWSFFRQCSFIFKGLVTQWEGFSITMSDCSYDFMYKNYCECFSHATKHNVLTANSLSGNSFHKKEKDIIIIPWRKSNHYYNDCLIITTCNEHCIVKQLTDSHVLHIL